jgi:hypothetical protein
MGQVSLLSTPVDIFLPAQHLSFRCRAGFFVRLQGRFVLYYFFIVFIVKSDIILSIDCP